MNLYHWHSTLLQNYSAGDIVTIAPDVERARAQVREHFEEWCRSQYWFGWDDDERKPEALAKLEADLAKDPTTQPVIFIDGGE
jgi:hypothetical protein